MHMPLVALTSPFLHDDRSEVGSIHADAWQSTGKSV